MNLELKIGQRFVIPSIIAQGYESLFGSFSFVVEIKALERIPFAPYVPPDGDLYLNAIDWRYRRELGFAIHSLAHGSEVYKPSLNYSPDIIAGEGQWFVPDLTRKQSWFRYLLMNEVITRVQ